MVGEGRTRLKDENHEELGKKLEYLYTITAIKVVAFVIPLGKKDKGV